MKRMVDDKEIREFDDRITYLEEHGGGGTVYTSGQFIYVDNQENTINLDYTDSNTIKFDTSDNRLWPKVKFGDGLNADQTGLYVDSSIARYTKVYTRNEADQRFALSTKVYTKDESDQKFVKILTEFDDEDNPESYHFITPRNYNGYIGLDAIQDDNNHPCDSNIYVYPSYVTITSNDYNHGPNDDTYTGVLTVTDNSVTLEATDGTDTTTLTVSPSGAKINGSDIITSSYAASTYTLALGTSASKLWYATITAEVGLEGTYGQTNDAWYNFIMTYAKYVTWLYVNDSDATHNHRTYVMTTPGQTLIFYDMMGSTFVPTIPPTSAELVVTKTN